MSSFNSIVLLSFTPGFSPVVNAPKSHGTVLTVSLWGLYNQLISPKADRVTGLKPGMNERWTNWSRNELGASSHA